MSNIITTRVFVCTLYYYWLAEYIHAQSSQEMLENGRHNEWMKHSACDSLVMQCPHLEVHTTQATNQAHCSSVKITVRPCLGLCNGCTVTSLTDSNSHLTGFGQQSGCTVKSSSSSYSSAFLEQSVRSAETEWWFACRCRGASWWLTGCELDIGWPIMAVGKEIHRWLLCFPAEPTSEQHQIWGTAALCHVVRASNHLPSCLPTLL
jgi:hypothetical protein